MGRVCQPCIWRHLKGRPKRAFLLWGRVNKDEWGVVVRGGDQRALYPGVSRVLGKIMKERLRLLNSGQVKVKDPGGKRQVLLKIRP